MATETGALDALFKKPAFAQMGEERLTLFRQFAKEIEGRNPAEIVARYVKLNTKLAKTGALTSAEKEAIAAAIKESLSEEDKKKFAMVLRMI